MEVIVFEHFESSNKNHYGSLDYFLTDNGSSYKEDEIASDEVDKQDEAQIIGDYFFSEASKKIVQNSKSKVKSKK